MISVLVVDDSVVVRRLISDALADDPGVQVVATAPNGRVALQKIEQLKPDLITLDVEMPVMDGIATLRELRRLDPRLPVIMFSTLTAAGANATLDALSAGASDYVMKPAAAGSLSDSIRGVREQLIPRIYALCSRRAARAAMIDGHRAAPGEQAAVGGGVPAGGSARVEAITIGCSTGGPEALARLIRALPGDLPVPVLVVQHMPPVFTKLFAERLDRTSALTVVEAAAGAPVVPGTVYIAPGDLHLEVHRRGAAVTTSLHTGPPENFCRPAVDVLFRSVNRVYAGAAVGVVLTGMGHDGRLGAAALAESGAEIVAQDESTSVVWGMPGAVVNAGLAGAVLPIDEIAGYLNCRVAQGRIRAVEASR